MLSFWQRLQKRQAKIFVKHSKNIDSWPLLSKSSIFISFGGFVQYLRHHLYKTTSNCKLVDLLATEIIILYKRHQNNKFLYLLMLVSRTIQIVQLVVGRGGIGVRQFNPLKDDNFMSLCNETNEQLIFNKWAQTGKWFSWNC